MKQVRHCVEPVFLCLKREVSGGGEFKLIAYST